jgi:uncharacterized membrane protein (DUF106 family)
MTNENLESNKKGSFTPVIIVMLITLVIAGLWDQVPSIKNSIHSVLDPSAGVLLNWNLNWGMTILVLIITLITTLVQKYATDQKRLKEIQKEQKEIQAEMQKLREHPEKMMELNKKSMPLMMEQMKLGMRGVVYTGIPFILLFRWFTDYFIVAGSPKVFGIGWIWFYLIGAIVIGSILRKITKTV